MSLRIWLNNSFKKILENNSRRLYRDWKLGDNSNIDCKKIKSIKQKKKILYDIFEGMPEPTNNDKDYKNINASDWSIIKE